MIVGTAGHIDHGKTTLLKALTGVDADRLPEEKARGITIDIGFAYQHFPDSPSISFLDVPGHEKLIRNMLVGAIGIDFVVLVVAADDGVMPQTREHLAIIDLVGVSRGVIAITKIDRVPESRVDEVEAAIGDVVDGTALGAAPVLRCSATTGEGIADIKSLIVAASHGQAARPPKGHFRLAVDRAFTLDGIGLVVTGTTYAGTVKAGDMLVHSPSGEEVRVRSLRSENREADLSVAGQRCALNLTGRRLEKDQIKRGDWILAPAVHGPTERIDVRLRLLPHEARGLKHWTPVHVHIGASDVTGRVSLLEGKTIEPGADVLAQLVVDAPVGALAGDRFVIRDQSATRTLGGGRVIDPKPPARGTRAPARLAFLRAMDKADPGSALTAVAPLAESGLDLDHFTLAWNLKDDEAAELWRANGVREFTKTPARLGITEERLAALRADVVAAVDAYQTANRDSPGATVEEILRAFRDPKLKALSRHAMKGLLDERLVVRLGHLVHLPGREIKLSPEDEILWDEIKTILTDAGLDPPRLTALAERLDLTPDETSAAVNKFSRAGYLARVSKAYFMLPEVVAKLASEAERVASAHQQKYLTVGNFREATNANRHMATPILEFFDKAGLTRRIREGRVMKTTWAAILEARET